MHWNKMSTGSLARLWPALLALLWLLVVSNGQVVFRPHFLYKQKQKEKQDLRREFEEAQRREHEAFELERFPSPSPPYPSLVPSLYPNYYDPYYYHYYQHIEAQQNQHQHQHYYREKRGVKRPSGLSRLVYASRY